LREIGPHAVILAAVSLDARIEHRADFDLAKARLERGNARDTPEI
jgi:hypothetical protein